MFIIVFFFFKQKTAYEMRISDWSSDVCSSDLIPSNFRDGVNPDARDEPRKMDWKSHGFRFLLQTHDSFTVELNLNHAKWQEAVINLLHVMERPCTINGHRVSVKTEAEFGRRW